MSTEQITDLVNKIQIGDEAAFGELYEELQTAIAGKQQELKPGINAEIRVHNTHKILISRAMHALEILALSAGD